MTSSRKMNERKFPVERLGMGDCKDIAEELVQDIKKMDISGQSSPSYYGDNNNSTSLSKNTVNRHSTHSNIFGESATSPQKSNKVYHMSSDIFGIGSVIDRHGQHQQNHSMQRDNRDSSQDPDELLEDALQSGRILASNSKSDDSVNGSTYPQSPDQMNRKANARENGCNPVTGDGYADDDVKSSKSQRRQYPRGRSQSLW